MEIKRTNAIVLAAIMVSGCASLTAQGKLVRVTSNPDVVRGCKFVGNVKASSGWGGPAGGNMGEDQVQTKLQNETAEMGGNVLYLTSNRAGGYGGSSRGIGEAYRCD
jgi:hypothetical protein